MTEPTVLQEPELRPFLPLLYVAWADGDLGHEERTILWERLAAQPGLKPRLREALGAWLDPANPPDAASLAELHGMLERAVLTLGAEAREGWLNLGGAMAKAGGATEPDGALRALQSLEDLLGQEREILSLRTECPADATFSRPPGFDVAALTALLDGEHADVRQKARAFLADPRHRAAYGMEKGAYREKVFGWLQELSDLGFGDLAFPGITTAAGDLSRFLVAFETLAYGDLSLTVKAGVQFGLWGGSIYFLGSDAQRKAWLPDVASLKAPGCFAMSEVGHGSNVADLQTLTRYEHATRELVVHTPTESARKDWAGNAALHARAGTVFTQLEVDGVRHGVHAVIVPLRDADGRTLPGIRIGDCGTKQGLNGVDNGRIWFEHVRVPVENLLSRHAQIDADGRYQSSIESPARRFFTMLGTLVGGRLSIAAAAVSAAKVGLTIALRYATLRRQFGPTSEPETLLLHYPTHQRRLLPHLAATYAAHFAIADLRADFAARVGDGDTRQLEARVAAIKGAATRRGRDAVRAAREACGGQGYLCVNRLPDLLDDTEIFTTFEGDNTVLAQLVAKSLLTNFRQQFERKGASAWVRVLAQRAVDLAAVKGPFTTHPSDAATLRSPAFQLDALRFRERSLLQSAAARVQKRARADMPASQAANEVQEHLVALAEAHADLLLLESFAAALEAAPRDVAVALGRLCAVFGLGVLELHATWFLEEGYLSLVQTRAIRREIPRLFGELLPDVSGLIDAFDIPETCLAAPIAFDDPAHPRW